MLSTRSGSDLPQLPPAATWLLVGMLAAVWLSIRIRILLRRDELRGPSEPPTPAWRWMRGLAGKPWILPALTWTAVGLLVATILVVWRG